MKQLDLKKDPFLTFFFTCLIILLFFLIGCLFLLKYLSDLQIQSQNQRYNSYQVASQLRQSSDDLTKMVRLYVITGDPKYRDYFHEILSIRNGTSPRPVCYEAGYWDLAEDSKLPCAYGENKSITQLMFDQGFTLEEFQLLDKALSLSDQSVLMKTKAINAMEGKFEDSSGQYTVEGKPDPELAKDLVFGKEYMRLKANIMEPIQQFFDVVEKRTQETTQRLDDDVDLVIIVAIALSILIALLMIYSLLKAIRSLSKMTEQNEMLLLNIFPQPIADRLKSGETLIADEFSQASILFADIVGFTALTYKIGVTKMVGILNELFLTFDDLSDKWGVEKLKTIGDNYMAAGGVPIPVSDHAIRMANFALAIREKMGEFNKKHNLNLQIRIGMTFGSVIAGVIGHKKFIYDVWGDVVNTASRMESTSLPGEIQITEKMAFMLNEDFEVIPREEFEVKGKGMMKTYFLKGIKKTS